MLRVLLSSASVCAFCTVIASGARAAEPPATAVPAPSCALPNAAARTLHAVEPDLPDTAKHFGVGGHVVVSVVLYSDGHVVSARASSWSSRFLVRSAIAAARASTFAPALRNCVPIGGTYAFTVNYSPPSPLPVPHVDVLTYFPGAWHCVAAAGDARTLVFVRDGDGLSETDGSAATSIALDSYRMWRIRRDGRTVGWAFPWVDDAWKWGSPGGAAGELDFRRVDDTTFKLTTVVGTELANVDKAETCTRVATAS